MQPPPETRPYDFDELVTRLEGIPEIQLTAYTLYIQFNLPPYLNPLGKAAVNPKYKTSGTLYVRIGRTKNDQEVSVTWYPARGDAPFGTDFFPNVFAFPDFTELQHRFRDPTGQGRDIPYEFYRAAWEKVYRAVHATVVEPEEMHTVSGWDESRLRQAIQFSGRLVKSAPRRPAPLPFTLPLLDIDRMHEMTDWDS